MAAPDVVDWDAIIRDPRFQDLHWRKILVLWGLMTLSVAYYFLLPIGAAYYQDLFTIRVWGDEETSFMGLEKPLFELKNPGLISIPLGFLGVIFGSLLMRDRRAEDMWNEVYARQYTGLLVSKSAAH